MAHVDVRASLEALARNFRWVWDEPTKDLYRTVNPVAWDRTRDPFALLRSAPPRRFAELAADASFVSRITAVEADLAKYMAAEPGAPEVAYFCMEHGIAPELRIYAGGLGMLAGCIEKTASDLQVPMVAVGLRYRRWFRQQLSYGWQSEDWQETDPIASGLELVPSVKVGIDLADEWVTVAVWRARVGRVDLYLLDTDVPENPPHLREITDGLYVGDKEHRLRQEIVLGVGGVRVLAELGLSPAVYHANEGHAGFMNLERIARIVTDGASMAQAVDQVRESSVFTTHTAVAAGFDVFERPLVERYFATWAQQCGVSMGWLMNLGHFPHQQPSEPFNMAVLCARLSSHVNAVSRLHREVTEDRVLGPLWPGHAAPIVAVTNGVHPRTWTPPEMTELFDRYVGPGWDYAGPEAWEGAWDIPDELLWQTRQQLRAGLVTSVRDYLPRVLREQGWGQDVDWAREVLDPEALTVVVARRAAEYKETDLLVSLPGRLRALVGNVNRPMQVLFAALAHPNDGGGKERIRRIVEFSLSADVRGRVLYLPGYNMRLAQILLAGADVWLNHPRRGDEACGTSFMKSVYCGGRIVSTADGGADELIVDGANGWLIGDRGLCPSRDVMANRTFEVLERSVVPQFFDRDADGVPHEWVAGIKRSLSSLGWQVSAGPMVKAYARMYREAARGAARQRTVVS